MNLGEYGKTAESKTAAFLRKRGYAVIKRNYSCRFGEIDIIAEKGEYIVFVEVKARSTDSIVSPKEAVDAVKRQKILLTAKDYITKTETELQPRFDVADVRISKTEDGRTVYSLNYITNAF